MKLVRARESEWEKLEGSLIERILNISVHGRRSAMPDLSRSFVREMYSRLEGSPGPGWVGIEPYEDIFRAMIFPKQEGAFQWRE